MKNQNHNDINIKWNNNSILHVDGMTVKCVLYMALIGLLIFKFSLIVLFLCLFGYFLERVGCGCLTVILIVILILAL